MISFAFFCLGLCCGSLVVFIIFKQKEKIMRSAYDDKISFFHENRQIAQEVFEAYSKRALDENMRSFLDWTKSNIEQSRALAQEDRKVQKEIIFQSVEPLVDSLKKMESYIQELEKSRVGSYHSVVEQLRSLAENHRELKTETVKLSQALKAPTTRGRWGEIQLRRVVELAGMSQNCDFTEQKGISTEDKRLRPDMTVHLPSGRNIVVDAKVPLSAYLEALEAQDDASRMVKLKEHSKKIRQHIFELSKKSYWEQFESSPEFVVLFLSGEIFFSAALEQDPDLIEYGIAHKIILATPTTLVSLLRTVAMGWKQDGIQKNILQANALSQELIKRFCDFHENFVKIGKTVQTSVDAFNKALGTYESRILSTARKFEELGLWSKDSSKWSEAQKIEDSTRSPNKKPLETLGGNWGGELPGVLLEPSTEADNTKNF